MTNPAKPTASKGVPADSTAPAVVTENTTAPKLEDATALTGAALEDKAAPKGGR
jgi:hypothetical protein